MAKKRKKFTRLEDFGPGLQGLGGLQTSRVRALKGSKFGPASKVRQASDEERKKVEERLRSEGKL